FGVGLAGWCEMHYEDPTDAQARNVDDAPVADTMVTVDHSDFGVASVSEAPRGRNPADVRPDGGDEFLRAGWHHHEPDADRAFRRSPSIVAASVLVLWTS